MTAQFAFGDYVLDTRTKQLLRHGTPVPLSADQFTLLELLVTRAGEVVPTAELEAAVRTAKSAPPSRDYSCFDLSGAVLGALFPIIDDNPTSYIPGITEEQRKELERKIAALKTDGSERDH